MLGFELYDSYWLTKGNLSCGNRHIEEVLRDVFVRFANTGMIREIPLYDHKTCEQINGNMIRMLRVFAKCQNSKERVGGVVKSFPLKTDNCFF